MLEMRLTNLGNVIICNTLDYLKCSYIRLTIYPSALLGETIIIWVDNDYF
jgi:hypothetical protein